MGFYDTRVLPRMQLANQRISAASVPVERSGLDGQSLHFDDDTFDAALSSWTLCTIPDVDAALREPRRVLKPGGTLHFLEHGLAPHKELDVFYENGGPKFSGAESLGIALSP